MKTYNNVAPSAAQILADGGAAQVVWHHNYRRLALTVSVSLDAARAGTGGYLLTLEGPGGVETTCERADVREPAFHPSVIQLEGRVDGHDGGNGRELARVLRLAGVRS